VIAEIFIGVGQRRFDFLPVFRFHYHPEDFKDRGKSSNDPPESFDDCLHTTAAVMKIERLLGHYDATRQRNRRVRQEEQGDREADQGIRRAGHQQLHGFAVRSAHHHALVRHCAQE
jgi:hypothetical protein